MSAIIRQLHPTTPAAPQTTNAPLADCQCGRGLVIGAFAVRAGGANDRLAFFPVGSAYADLPDCAADLCCLDCVTDAVAELASGETYAEMQEISRERREEQRSLAARSQISVAAPPRQTPPTEGDQMT